MAEQWKLLFALSRWGGLRCPSEPRLLTWDDIDWDRQRFLVHAPKTEHREGHGTRWVPIFPELAELFDQRWNEAEPGDMLVLPFMATRTAGTFSRRVARAVVFAGVKPWPRLFHSMRSTRQTELADRFPIHTVCTWIGNSEAIATKHYLQTTEQHFAEAARNAAQTTAKPRQGKTRRSVAKRKPLDSRTVAVAGVGGL
jgi:integrase